MVEPVETRGVFVSWVRFHGRSQALAEALGLEPVYVQSRWRTPLKYLPMFLSTIRWLRSPKGVSKPSVVFVMLPPFPALVACLLGRPRNARLVADLHTGVFLDPKWKPFLGLTLRLLRRHDVLAIVTNDALAEVLTAKSVKAFVMHDLLVSRLVEQPPSAASVETTAPYFVAPVAYASDEPLDELFTAARTTPEAQIVLTGTAPEVIQAKAPANVRFSGYLSNDAFDDLLAGAAGVVALTTEDHTMQRAGYEALERGLPLLISDFGLLRDYFEDAAIYTDPTVPGIATGLARLGVEGEGRRTAMASLRDRRIAEQDTTVEALHRVVEQGAEHPSVETTALVASQGGHLQELVLLASSVVEEAGGRLETIWFTSDSTQSRSLLVGKEVEVVANVAPRELGKALKLIPAFRRLYRKHGITQVLSTGAAVAVPAAIAARSLGLPFTYVESLARTDGPSLTGKLLSLIPGVHLRTQYERWAGGRWRYEGSILDAFRASVVEEGEARLETTHLKVFVTVGTQRYPFTRLLDRVKQILPPEAEVRWQTADSLLSPEELDESIAWADVVIGHAGVGTALTALQAGKMPVLVPRRAAFGEHVDDHQQLLAAELATRGLAVTAEADQLTLENLARAAAATLG